MATREENLKKINDELEKLSDEELDNVAGGTNGEYKELRKLLPTTLKSRKMRYHGTVSTNHMMNPDEVSGWLKENLNIDAQIDNGPWYNPFDSAGNPNVYSRNGQSLTHAQVMAEVKNFVGK